MLASFSVVEADVPGEITVNYSPEIVDYSWDGFFGPNKHVWFNFTIEDGDTLADLSYVKVVTYHRQFSSLSDSNSKKYHYTFVWTWSEGWYEVDLTGHLGSSYAPTDPTDTVGDWKLEIVCDEECVPGLWAIYLEVMDSKNAMTTLTINVEGYGPYDVIIKSVNTYLISENSMVKCYIEVANRNPKYSPDVILVIRITDESKILAEKNKTINVPSGYSSLFSEELTFTGLAGKTYTLIAFVVDPLGISTPPASYTFIVVIPTAAPPPPPAIAPSVLTGVATMTGMNLFMIIALAFVLISFIIFTRPLSCMIKNKVTECVCMFGNTFVVMALLSVVMIIFSWVFSPYLSSSLSIFTFVLGFLLFLTSLAFLVLHGSRCPVPI
ncbi:MAG: hypothetical protein DRJ03_10085 [Chloroflexi bacterium]|nr:MAG: hypothetical protein DRJ03_10085 [Chloroflexota bacterium]